MQNSQVRNSTKVETSANGRRRQTKIVSQAHDLAGTLNQNNLPEYLLSEKHQIRNLTSCNSIGVAERFNQAAVFLPDGYRC